jgi:pilus assembly protein Flp/PilA
MKHITAIRHFFLSFFGEKKGVTAVEYGLIAALIAAVIIGGVSALGTNIQAVFTTVANTI